jgi:hypothetical protein
MTYTVRIDRIEPGTDFVHVFYTCIGRDPAGDTATTFQGRLCGKPTEDLLARTRAAAQSEVAMREALDTVTQYLGAEVAL